MRVVIESPWAGNVNANRLYALRCLRDSLQQGESPFMSHLLYPLVSENFSREERDRGMKAGREWIEVADRLIMYIDYGVSPGMNMARERAEELRIEIVVRKIGK